MSKFNTEIINLIESKNLPYSLGASIFHLFNSINSESNELEELEKALWFLNKRVEGIQTSLQNTTREISLNNINFFCISLKDRQDRKNWIDSHLPKFGIDFQYHDAFTTNEKYPNLNFGPRYSQGHMGCAVSHYDLIKNYKGTKILGIFEDDVQLCEDFNDRMDYVEKNFDLDWDIFFLSSFYHLHDDNAKWHSTGDFDFTNIKYIHRVYGTFCTHSYLVNPKSIHKIINLMETNLKDSRAIDHLYILIQPQLKCYSFTPGMTTQIKGYSNISNHEKNQQEFERIVGKHYYIDNLKDFDYEDYFKKYKK